MEMSSSVAPEDSVLTESTAAQPEAQQPLQTTQSAAITSEVGRSGNSEPEHVPDSPTSELLFSPRSLANVAERFDQLELMLNSDDFFDERNPELEKLQAEVIKRGVFCLLV